MREVFRHHGLPESIINDHGPQLVYIFWKHLFKMLKVICNLSSDYHPQTDGQQERTNQTLEQCLQCFLSYQQDDWVDIDYTLLNLRTIILSIPLLGLHYSTLIPAIILVGVC